jgi:formylglycine-generating enzyme
VGWFDSGRAVLLVPALVLGACLTEIPPLNTDPLPGGAGGTGAAGAAGGGAAGGAQGGGGAAGGAGGPCPDDMVHASDAELDVSFCIDRTEVTQARYVAFLSAVGADPAQTEQPGECAFNQELTHTPDGSCPDFTTASDLPVWCVDWCDAYAFCAWAGKRLCGALGGGTLALDAPVTSDEWHFACSGGFMTTYPYGNDPMVGACNIPNENTPEDPSDNNTKAPVGSYPACEGGLAGLFDMQGNVSEWIDRCDPGTGNGDEECSQRGGHTFGTAVYWRCNNLDESGARNDPDAREVGFRCCRDAD